MAQQQPVPLFNTLPANPPLSAGAPAAPPPDQGMPPSAAPAQPASPPTSAGRVFCDQTVSAQPADPRSVPDRCTRQFVGIFSERRLEPQQLCAALLVETISR